MGICCVAQGTQAGALYQSRWVGCGGDEMEFHKGGDMCIPMADP